MRGGFGQKALLWEQYRKMHQLTERVIDKAESLLQRARPGSAKIALNTIRYSARSAQTILQVALTPEIQQYTERQSFGTEDPASAR